MSQYIIPNKKEILHKINKLLQSIEPINREQERCYFLGISKAISNIITDEDNWNDK
jgi:hypothetical protein